MKRSGNMVKLSGIGVIAGIVLAVFLKIIEWLTGSTVYYLLFHVDYVPLLRSLSPVSIVEVCFHFGTCMLSVLVLYAIFRLFHLEKSIAAYTILILLGSSLLYFLTMFSAHTPAVNDWAAWSYWVIGHGLFGVVVGVLIRRWL